MQKTKFLTIYPTFENLEVVKQTLPSIIKETKINDAKLIVHDSSVKGKKEKWEYLQSLNKNNDFFLLLSDNLSMAHARNMCLQLGQELYAPDYICMVEDDHGFNEGLILFLVDAMKKYYGKKSQNGLIYGLFTGCAKHSCGKKILLDDGNSYPDINQNTGLVGGVNSCFRCAPTSHWNNVLKGYDTDEYLISTFQTKHLNFRNYHKGFTSMVVQDGKYLFDVDHIGRGFTSNTELRLWDENYAASDPRSNFLNKKGITIKNKKNSVFEKIKNKIKKKYV